MKTIDQDFFRKDVDVSFLIERLGNREYTKDSILTLADHIERNFYKLDKFEIQERLFLLEKLNPQAAYRVASAGLRETYLQLRMQAGLLHQQLICIHNFNNFAKGLSCIEIDANMRYACKLINDSELGS